MSYMLSGKIPMQHANTYIRSAVVFSIVALTFALTTFFRNGIWKNDIFLWDDAAAKSPNDGKVLANLGTAWMNVGRNDIARAYFEKSKSIKPYWNTAFLFLGDIYLIEGKSDEAEKEFRAALSRYKHDTGALLRIAMLDIEKGRLQEALDGTNHILRLDERFPDAYMVQGMIYAKMKMPEDAERSLEKALALSPDHPRILLNLGIVKFEAGKYSEAEACLSTIGRFGPLWAEANLWLGRTYYGSGRYAKSVEVFERYLSLKPRDNNARLELALAYEKAGLHDKALDENKKYLAVISAERKSEDRLKK